MDAARQTDRAPVRLCAPVHALSGLGSRTDSHQNCLKVNLSASAPKTAHVGLFDSQPRAAGWNSVALKLRF